MNTWPSCGALKVSVRANTYEERSPRALTVLLVPMLTAMSPSLHRRRPTSEHGLSPEPHTTLQAGDSPNRLLLTRSLSLHSWK